MYSKTLIIPEKPSVARDIADALGGGFSRVGDHGRDYLERDDIIIASAIGHLVSLQCPPAEDPGNNLLNLPVLPSKFNLAAKEETVGQLALLGRLMSHPDVGCVVNACDAGREGELIFRFIQQYHDCQKKTYRMWLQSMTPTAILAAFDEMQPAANRDNLYHAAICRAESDWIIGINGSRAIEVLYRKATGTDTKITVGRVQTVVVALIVERDISIKNFVAKDYYEVIATLGANFPGSSLQYQAKWTNPNFSPDPNNLDAKHDRVFSKDQADAIAAKCRGQQPSSVHDETIEHNELPPKLFDLTTLQRVASTRYGLTAKQTLAIAQALYEKHKALTYPRTDATALPEDYIPTTIATLTRISQSSHPLAPYAVPIISCVQPDKRIFNDAKISDHFAIVPTGRVPTDLTANEAKIYDLVVCRFISVFYPAAQYQQTIRTTIINGEVFRSSGRILVSEGWKSIDKHSAQNEEGEGNDAKEQVLCPLPPGQILPLINVTPIALKTKKPRPYTEATLLAAMESAGAQIEDEDLREAMKDRGLGTPATRAPTIEHLLDKDVAYLVREKKNILATQKAFDLIAFLRSNGLDFLTVAKTTGDWEYALLQMEQGQYQRATFMAGIHQMARAIIDCVKASVSALPGGLESVVPQATNIPCPKCQQALTNTLNAISCQCGFTLRKTILGHRLTDEECTLLLTSGSHPPISGFMSTKGKGKLFSAGLRLNVDMNGKVDFVFEDKQVTPGTDALQAPGETHACPTCGKPLRQRSSPRGGTFWGCTGYPKCKKTLPDDNGRPKF